MHFSNKRQQIELSGLCLISNKRHQLYFSGLRLEIEIVEKITHQSFSMAFVPIPLARAAWSILVSDIHFASSKKFETLPLHLVLQ